MIDKFPTKCNLCGGEVEYIPNDKIYGKSYGSGYCYHCKSCGAYTGTHKPRPKEAEGLLADKEMRQWKMYCHKIFDILWKVRNKFWYNGKIYPDIKPKYQRGKCYKLLAQEMGIPQEECHIGYFNLPMLKYAYACIKKISERNEEK